MRYFFGFLAAVGLIVVVFILILKGFGGHGTPKNQINLLDYANTQTEVQMTVDGPINASQDHRGYQITVGRDTASIQTTTGYQGSVIQAQTYANNATAYANFLRALQLLNFTKGNPDPAKADERGACPSGRRYVFEIVTADQDSERYWSTSCGGGTFQGNTALVRQLFNKQIPDYERIVSKIQL